MLWTWVGGLSTGGNSGTYGTKGTGSTSNIPGSREYPCSAINPAGTILWLFGGTDLSGGSNKYSDLWKYTISSGEWTWMSGSGGADDTVGVYGTKGTAAAANFPGYRREAACWTDSSGNFWLFGGLQTSSLQYNDLWKFDISTGWWTWVSGENTTNYAGNYGTKGVTNSSNEPPARERPTYWKDNSGNFWIFGGYDDAAGGKKNDLWKYNISSNQWTWMTGASTISDAGNYGTKGVPSTSNSPPYKSGAVGATDSNGNLWLYGGYSASAATPSNDLWKYNPSTNEWTWVSGASTAGQAGTYATKTFTNPNTVPPAKLLSGMIYRSQTNELLVIGGYNGTATVNDLMVYSIDTGNWTWLSGATTTGAASVYGTKGTASWANAPGARDGMSFWVDPAGDFWFFGGASGSSNATTWNDLWKGSRY